MDDQPRQASSFSILGKIIALGNASTLLAGYQAEAWVGDQLLVKTTSDGFGRFLLETSLNVEEIQYIFVHVFTPWGASAGQRTLSLGELFSPNELTFLAIAEKSVPFQPSLVTLPAIMASKR